MNFKDLILDPAICLPTNRVSLQVNFNNEKSSEFRELLMMLLTPVPYPCALHDVLLAVQKPQVPGIAEEE